MASIDIASTDLDAAGWYLARSAIFNRCNLSPWALASQTFQARPQAVEIAWVRREHHDFFALLGRIADPTQTPGVDRIIRSSWA
jgi:hypothetical protein